MKKKNKFAKIKTAKELEKALRSIKEQQRRLGDEIERDLKDKREQLQPANLALNALQHITPYDNWSDLTLGIVRSAKRLLTPTEEDKAARKEKRAEKKAAKKAAKEAASEEDSFEAETLVDEVLEDVQEEVQEAVEAAEAEND